MEDAGGCAVSSDVGFLLVTQHLWLRAPDVASATTSLNHFDNTEASTACHAAEHTCTNEYDFSMCGFSLITAPYDVPLTLAQKERGIAPKPIA